MAVEPIVLAAAPVGSLKRYSRTVMKPTILLIAVTTVLAALAGCKTSHSRPSASEVSAIERVFAADVDSYKRTLGARRSNDASSSLASLVQLYTSALRNISFAEVPNEFHYAYMEHIHAWESMQVVLQRKPQKGDLSMLLGLLTVAGGQPQLGLPALLNGANASDRSARETDHERKAAADQIRLTWNKIELLAVGRGARIPKPSAD